MINAKLRVIGGKHSNQLIPLSHKKFLIGREQDCQLRPNSELVSRHHCIFTVDDFSVRLRDLGSTNGTLVNGERIRKEVVLNAGDKVTVGSLEFEVEVGATEETPVAPAPPVAPSEDTMVQTGSDTLNEMPAISPAAAAESTEPMAEEQQTAAPAEGPAENPPAAAPAAPAAEAPAAPIVAPEAAPPASAGDTTVIGQPVLMPGQQPYQPMMPPMGYPQQPMYGAAYPYPGMPGQQMPMYPQQPGYPAPGFPGAPPMQQQPAAAPAVAEPEPSPSGVPEVSLPDPSETGAKAPEPAPPKAETEGEAEAKEQEEKSNQSAAAIIQQHMQRRPGG